MLKKPLRIISTTLAILTLALIGIATLKPKAAKAAPVTFVVNSINDGGDANNGNGVCETSTPGECTLRAAIEQANTNGNPSDQDVITFDIPGTGLHTIVSSNWFVISQPLEIDGYSDNGDGADPNSQAWPSPFDGALTIEIDSTALAGNLTSFRVASDDVTFKGLIVNGSINAEFAMDSAVDNIRFYGNYLGTNSSGLVSGGSNKLISATTGGNGLIIGGSLPEQRNVIASNYAVLNTDFNNVDIKGNYIGVGADGITPLPSAGDMNQYMMDISGNNASIGGTALGEGNSIENANNFAALALDTSTNSSILGNRISGNNSAIFISGESSGTVIGNGTVAGRNVISGNDILSSTPGYPQTLGNAIALSNPGSVSIKGNYIGVAEDGVTALGNGSNGIIASSADDLTIGGTGVGEGNIIANNGLNGIHILDETSNVNILGNSLYANAGLGIEIAPNGVNLNDSLDADTGPNGLLNYPSLLVPVELGGDTDISYRLDVPAGDYRVEFFSNTAYDPSGHGEGRTFIGSDTVTSLGAGAQLFSATITGDTYDNISATVTEIDVLSVSGYGATSEFSGQPFSDGNLSVSKAVVDQDTIITNGTIQYDISITNTGIDPIDLTQYTVDSGDPLNTALFNDIFPNNLTLDSVTGDADCTEQNPSSDPLFSTSFSAHTAHTVASCSYTGLATTLAPAGILDFTLTFSLTDPALNTFSNYVLTVPSTSDSDYSEYDDALSSGDDILDILDGNINNLAVATTTTPESDISITKNLLTDIGDVAAGSSLSYELTYTNDGPDPLFIGNNKDTSGSSPLFYDYLHPDLSVSAGNVAFEDASPGINLLNVGNADLTCIEITPGLAAIYFSLVTYSDYSVISCWYTGLDITVASGVSHTATFSVDVSGGSELDFANFAYAQDNLGGSRDPDSDNIADAILSGDDSLDGFINYHSNPGNTAINNFAISRLPIDVTVNSELIDPPTSIYEGVPVKVQVTLTNNGPSSFNLSHYPDYISSVFSTLYSGDDLTFVGLEDDLLSCLDAGPDGAAFIGVAGEDHPGLGLVVCTGAGSDIVIPADGTQSFTLLFSAKSTVSSNFGFYSLNSSAVSDPDIPGLFGAIFGASEDVMDTISNNNYSSAYYSGTVIDNPNISLGNSNTNQNGNGGLSNTGQNVALLIAGAVILMGTSFVIYKKTRIKKAI